MRMGLDAFIIESRPIRKPMHKQPFYNDVFAYLKGVSEELFNVGMCLPAGPYVTEDDVLFICEAINSIINNTIIDSINLLF